MAGNTSKMTVRNMTARVVLPCSVDLGHIGRVCAQATYEPGRFEAGVIRLENPRTTALVCRTGKLFVSGVDTEDALREAAERHVECIRKARYSIPDYTMNVHSVAGKYAMECELNLRYIQGVLRGHMATPEGQHLALVVCVIAPDARDLSTVLIFRAGDVICTSVWRTCTPQCATSSQS